LMLAAALTAAKLLGELAQRIGQPAVLGELVAGVLVGPSVLAAVDPAVPSIHIIAEIGIIILLFEIGLETKLKSLLSVGGTATTVALVGVALPFGLGFGVAELFAMTDLQALVLGAALTATSVGITARVLSDLGRLQDPESQVVLGAAVIDDIVGLVILAVVTTLVAGGELTATGVTVTTLIAFGFVAAALLLGRVLIPPVFSLLTKLGDETTIAIMGVVVALYLAVAADAVGSAMIIGAFSAGLLFAPTEHAAVIERGVVRLGHFFVPIFFVSVGAAVDVRTFADPRVLAIGGLLILVAIVGKFLAGFAPVWFKGRKAVIGVGMIPRGEVGLIFAQMGLASGVLDAGLYAALTLMVMVTTFVAPPVLKALLGGSAARRRGGGDRPGELVSDI
ncbi:MAG TPA: cation:proton antiporter, partial [Gemmatimonadales bacterium]|nr:cation:proton antiporter [Gemmatimonadales bacterium]